MADPEELRILRAAEFFSFPEYLQNGKCRAIIHGDQLFSSPKAEGMKRALAERLSMPLRFYHSEADRVIPVSEMRALQKKMQNCPNAVFAEVPVLKETRNWWDDYDAPVAYFATVLDEFCRLELS